MGTLFRRVLSFALGMVFGVTSLLGGIVGGAYWAYKNVKPLEMVNKEEEKVAGLGELESASIEELLNLISDAVNNPDEYKIKRLEKEYGLDLASVLKSAGIDTENASQVDLDAIRDISLFSIVNGGASFLDGIKVRALYVFLPKILGKPIDEVLSSEAQAKLGDYSILDIFSKDELTGEIGLVSALKNLKFGAILPAKFEAKYNRATHEYDYTAIGDENGLLSMLGNVYVGTIFDVLQGSSIVDEVMEGGLESIGALTIEEVLVAIGGMASSDVKSFFEKRAKGFGNATVSDLFVKVDGNYKITLDNICDEIKIGYILGYTLGDDGLWYSDESCQNQVDGLKSAIASANVKELLDNKGDMLALINSAFGDVAIGDFLDVFNSKEKLPKGFQAVYGVTVGAIIGEEGSDLLTNIRTEFSKALKDTTLQELLDLKTDSAVVNSVYQIKVGELIKPGVTGEEILQSIQNALNGVAIGDLLGYERDGSGKWNCDNQFLARMLDVTFGEAPAGLSLLVLVSIFSEGGVTGIAQSIFGDLTIGDAFAVIFKYEYDEIYKNWYKKKTQLDDDGVTELEVREYLDPDFATAMHIKVWEAVATFDKTNDYVLYEDLKQLSIGETLFSLLSAIDKLPSGFIAVEVDEYEYLEGMTEDGYALENPDSRQLSEILFQIDVEEFRLHRKDKQYWLDKMMPVTAQSLLGMFLTEEQENANAFIKATLGVSVGEIIDLTDTTDDLSGKEVLSNVVKNHYNTVEINGEKTTVYIGDFLELITKDWRNNCTMDAIGNLEFSKSVCAILGTESKREAFGHLTFEELGGSYVPTKLQKSDFVNATLKINLDNLADIYKNRNKSLKEQIKYSFEILEPIYDGLTVMDSIDDFRNLGDKFADYGPILDFEIDDIMRALRTGEYGTLLDDFKLAFKSLDKKEKIFVLGAAGGGVLALYELDYKILVKLIGQVFDDATWGEYLASRFGYTLGNDGNYTISGVYNQMADKVFKQKMRETFDKSKFSIKEEYLKQVTFGEMMTCHKKLISYFDKANDLTKVGKLASDEDGIYLQGHFNRVTKKVFNIKVYDVYKNRNNVKGFILDNFSDVLLGDLGAGICSKALKSFGINHTYKFNDGKYEVDGAFKNLSEQFYNTTLYDFYKQRKSLIRSIVKSANTGDVMADVSNYVSTKLPSVYNGKATLNADGSWTLSGDFDEILSALYNLNIDDTISKLKADGISFLSGSDALGDIKIGYVFAKGNNEWKETENAWFTPSGEPVEFVGTDGIIKKTLYKLTFGEVLNKEFKFNSIIDGIYLGEFLDYTCQNDGVGHDHNETCVWYENATAIVQGEEGLGAQEVVVKCKELYQTIASLTIKALIDGDFSLETIFADSCLGDVIGFKNDGGVWYEYQTESGKQIVTSKDFGERVIKAEPTTKLAQTLSGILAKDLTKSSATETIINKVKALKLGDTLEYVETDGVWYKKEVGGTLTRVSGLMQKLSNHTIFELEGDLNDIIHEWTLVDVLSAEDIESNSILNAIKNVPLNEIASEIENVEFGEILGYEKKVDGKWYKKSDGTIVTDEIAIILSDYKVGQVTGKIPTSSGKEFTADVVDKMLDGLTLKTIYADAGSPEADGFMSILDPDWKLKDLSDNLMTKIKQDTTIQQLINLGVFGDFLVADSGYTDLTMPAKIYNELAGKEEYTNYGLIDTIFIAFTPTGMTAREYWLGLSMPEFMSQIMQTVTVYQQWFIDNKAMLEYFGIALPSELLD